MKKTINLSILLAALTFGGCNHSAGKANNFHSIDTNQLAKGESYYQCSMHPDEISDSSHSCPVCDEEMEKHIKQ